MSLVLYSSSDSDDEEKKNPKRLKLPSVNLQLENEIDLSEKDFVSKNDRIRLFAHERGNWALSIYSFGKTSIVFINDIFFSVDCSSHLDTMIDDLIEIFDENQWKRLTELHISLSKTFPIRFLHIESIRQGIQHELSISKICFTTRIENVTILTNEDGSTLVHIFQPNRNSIFFSL